MIAFNNTGIFLLNVTAHCRINMSIYMSTKVYTRRKVSKHKLTVRLSKEGLRGIDILVEIAGLQCRGKPSKSCCINSLLEQISVMADELTDD